LCAYGFDLDGVDVCGGLLLVSGSRCRAQVRSTAIENGKREQSSPRAGFARDFLPAATTDRMVPKLLPRATLATEVSGHFRGISCGHCCVAVAHTAVASELRYRILFRVLRSGNGNHWFHSEAQA